MINKNLIALCFLMLLVLFSFGCVSKEVQKSNDISVSDDIVVTDDSIIVDDVVVNDEDVIVGNDVVISDEGIIAGDVKLTIDEAYEIAKNSECVKEGNLTSVYIHNDVTDTWWIDIDVSMPGCFPACVVHDVTGEAEVNYRCTGVIA